MDFHTLGVPFSVINAFFRRRSSCFHYLAITMPPARGMGLLPPARPDRRGHPPSQERSHLDLLPSKCHPTASAELTFRGSNSQRSTLAWRCRRRRKRDRWTPRRRFQVRSAGPRAAADGSRPGECPGTRGAGDSGRSRTAPVRPQSALPSSLLTSPPPPPRPTHRPSTRGALPPAGPSPRRRRPPRPVAARPRRRRASRPHPPLLLVAARGRRRPRWGMRVTRGWMRRGTRPGI